MMKSQLTINKKKLTELLPKWGNRFVMAKDNGAYVCGKYNEKEQNSWPIYFRGCNPDKDENYYDTSVSKFGGDDFSVDLSSMLDDMKAWTQDDKFHSMIVEYNPKKFTVEVKQRRLK